AWKPLAAGRQTTSAWKTLPGTPGSFDPEGTTAGGVPLVKGSVKRASSQVYASTYSKAAARPSREASNPSRRVRDAFLKSLRPPTLEFTTISSRVSTRKAASEKRVPLANDPLAPTSALRLVAGRSAKLSPVAPPGR